ERVPYRTHKCIGHHLKAIAEARRRPDTADTGYLDEWRLFFRAGIGYYPARAHMAAGGVAGGGRGLGGGAGRADRHAAPRARGGGDPAPDRAAAGLDPDLPGRAGGGADEQPGRAGAAAGGDRAEAVVRQQDAGREAELRGAAERGDELPEA